MLATAILLAASGVVARADTWDLDYLVHANPDLVTSAELAEHADELEMNYQLHHQSNGITWPAHRSEEHLANPDQMASGGDAAIFTGMYLSAAVYRFLVTRKAEDLDPVLETLRGLHLLSHISGTPGVLARCAFPLTEAAKFRYPERWEGVKKTGKLYETPDPSQVPDALDPTRVYPHMMFFTDTSRDQLTGVLYGLSVTWAELSPARFADRPDLLPTMRKARDMIAAMTEDFWQRLEATGFLLKDQAGKPGKSGADLVDGLLRLQLTGLYRAVLVENRDMKSLSRIDREYQKAFGRQFYLFGGNFKDVANAWANFKDYYAWNLRFLRAHSVLLLDRDPLHRVVLRNYIRTKLWKHVRKHENTHFTYIFNATQKKSGAGLKAALHGLKALYLKPLRSWHSPWRGKFQYPDKYHVLLFGGWGVKPVPVHLRAPEVDFLWQRSPWTAGFSEDREGLDEATGLDFLLPYWMGRYYGFINP